MILLPLLTYPLLWASECFCLCASVLFRETIIFEKKMYIL